MKKTKIVATIGPATDSEEVLEQLIAAGMNIARFNTKHSSPEWHHERIERVKELSKKLNQAVGVLLDLQGPEVRIETLNEEPIKVKQGDFVYFCSDKKEKSFKNIAYIPQMVVDAIPVKNEILLDDGACEFAILEKSANYLKAQALLDCTVGHRKTLNTPGVVLEMPSLTERDITFLDGVNPNSIDYVGLSFVRNKEDIEILRDELKRRKMDHAAIVAKIENQAALDNIDEIIDASEAVMVARGDLGIEVHYKELTHWQKEIIKKCRKSSKPVITATQMLKSMVEKSRATRAEVSDVANAIYDGTDAVMLSEETTIGQFPVQAVTVQAQISEYNEPFTKLNECLSQEKDEDFTASIARSAIELLDHSDLDVDKIVCLTTTGKTARLISRFRSKTPIAAVTTIPHTYSQLALSYGVTPYLVEELSVEKQRNMKTLLDSLKKKKIVNIGETIVLIHGKYLLVDGFTNTLSITKVI